MSLHNNKIVISSIIYAASLLVIALVFGLWHNYQLKYGNENYLLFIILLIIAVSFFTWFYFTIFKVYRNERSEKSFMTAELLSKTDIIETTKSDEKPIEVFDKEAFFSGIIPVGKKSVVEYCEAILHNLSEKLNIVQGLFYIKLKNDDTFEPIARYAYYSDQTPPAFKMGESLPGQAIKDKKVVIIPNVPDDYISVVSGLGSSKPKNLVMLPIIAENEPVGLIEIAVFKTVDANLEPVLKELGGIIGKSIIKLMK